MTSVCNTSSVQACSPHIARMRLTLLIERRAGMHADLAHDISVQSINDFSRREV